ncbi:uncharacterized protein LOC111043751 isoform X2 [Nilaparvata lugens]|uniref:uncharacterized protein LOC111043751 isoform X2 n=1 Tax=Nilaparvata lugens TaxID=108931 RepID=UPI00193E342A|nr:uncharacterized protein LOC111043751 isoform X2 [Nilaparvata lugens]
MKLSEEQLLDSFTSLLRTITGLTPFIATMFLFVCMFSTKEKMKHIRGELKNITFMLESKKSKKTRFLPDVEDIVIDKQSFRRPVKLGLMTLYLKLKSLRDEHNNLLFSSQSLNKRFQTDLLFMIVQTFYLLLMCTYGLAFNIGDIEEKGEYNLIKFFILILTIIVYRLFLCWLVCYGASSIDVESKLLEMAIMKLSLSNIKQKRSQVEIQLFYLQCKNREAPFNIFGMFAIGKSFMFMVFW